MCADFSQDGTLLATGGADGDKTIRLWGRDNQGNPVMIRTLTGHTDWVRSVKFSPDGQKIASASWDGSVVIWGVQTGRQIHTYRGHDGMVFSAAWSPDNKMVASGGEDKTVRLWNAGNGSQVFVCMYVCVRVCVYM